MKHDPDNLDHLLREWHGVPAPDGRLAAPVWQRIETVKGRASWFGIFVMRLHELDVCCARPQVVAAVIAVGLLVGLGCAELRTRQAALQIDSEMSARYLALIEPSVRK